MRFSYFDDESITKSVAKKSTALNPYRKKVNKVVENANSKSPEYSLVSAGESGLASVISGIQSDYKTVKHLILIGIGGSSLGVEAIHSVLDVGKVKLTVLDTVSAYDIAQVVADCKKIKNPKQLAICVVSKSGGTTETLVNTSVLIENLEKQYSKKLNEQIIFIGDPDSKLLVAGKRLKYKTITMPKIVGGRYSVTTAVGLVPLALLKHDVEAFVGGVQDAASDDYEEVTTESATRIFAYIKSGFAHYNFFAFEKRLEKLGAWYRQLFAESLGKAETKKKLPVSGGMLPTITTPVELHSVGQLYLSGFPNVYTDFVTFDDEALDYSIQKKGIAKEYGKFTTQEVATAIYGGVIGAYQEKKLPYRTTIFDEDIAYSLGLFMAMRMREVMYVAELLNVNAFNQPNVELYKKKTKKILNI